MENIMDAADPEYGELEYCAACGHTRCTCDEDETEDETKDAAVTS